MQCSKADEPWIEGNEFGADLWQIGLWKQFWNQFSFSSESERNSLSEKIFNLDF